MNLDSLLSALGLKHASVIGGFLGALISLKFIEDIGEWSMGRRATTVFSGALVAAYCTPLTMGWLEVAAKAEGAVAFISGLFGMSLAGAIIRTMPEFMKALRERIGGGS